MSQNKTVIQGLEPGNVNSTNNYGGESSAFILEVVSLMLVVR